MLIVNHFHLTVVLEVNEHITTVQVTAIALTLELQRRLHRITGQAPAGTIESLAIFIQSTQEEISMVNAKLGCTGNMS